MDCTSAHTGEGARRALVVAGPTASGKSSLAVDVAEAFGGTVINADSMQVYRDLRVLTARPSEADERRVPHRLFGVLGAGERCSAGRWLGMAVEAIEEAFDAGRLPVITGGTGLYLRALLQGLAPVPPVPEAVRAEVRRELERKGAAALRAELAKVDPDAAARLGPGDTQRVTRALEVFRASDRPLSTWLGKGDRRPLDDVRFVTLLFDPPRKALYVAIDARFDAMLAAGGLDEVRALLALGLDPDLPAMKAVGVRELAGVLDGSTTVDAAAEAAKQASRNYAKRQLTWFRNQMHADEVLHAQYSESLKPKIFSFIRRCVLTGAG